MKIEEMDLHGSPYCQHGNVWVGEFSFKHEYYRDFGLPFTGTSWVENLLFCA